MKETGKRITDSMKEILLQYAMNLLKRDKRYKKWSFRSKEEAYRVVWQYFLMALAYCQEHYNFPGIYVDQKCKLVNEFVLKIVQERIRQELEIEKRTERIKLILRIVLLLILSLLLIILIQSIHP